MPSNFVPEASSDAASIAVEPNDVIDDLESDTGSIIAVDSRVGAWFTYNDGTIGGSQSPLVGGTFLPELVPGPDGADTLAAHTHGGGFTAWGAGMGFDLNNSGSTKATYDASDHTGIVFWAAGTAPVRIKLLTSATTLMSEGGDCTGTCGDNHGKIVTLTNQWQEHAVAFSELTQENWGAKAEFDAATVIGIQFQIQKNTPFDVWIDDVAFY